MNPFVFISGALLLIVVLVNILFFKKARVAFTPFELLLNSKKWKLVLIPLGESPVGYYGYRLSGLYKNRKVTCAFSIKPIGWNFLYSTPKIVPKKVNFFKFYKEYPPIYKNYKLMGGKVINTKMRKWGEKLTPEECVVLLDDLVHACEIVESGEYEI